MDGSLAPTPTNGSWAATHDVPGPLTGIRVIDLTAGAAAYCGKLLADLGADVVKVDPPDGNAEDHADASVPGKTSTSFRHYNTSKRSIVLDPARTDDEAVLTRLLAGADALILNGSPSKLEPRGLDPEDLNTRHPHLIIAAISPFGLSGPRRSWKSCDLVAQAMGGLVYVNGHPDEPPVRAWGPQSHHAASLHAAIGILLALLARERTATGQIVDVSLQESVTSMLEHVGATFHATGEVQERRGTLHWTRTFRVGRCRDGYVLLSILGDWTSLIEWMKAEGEGHEFSDSAWEDIEYRRERCEPLFDALGRWASRHSVRELVTGAQLRRLPFAPLLSAGDLPQQEQLVARRFFVPLDGARYPGAPYRFSATPWRLRSAAPGADEHRDEILRELREGSWDRPDPPAGPASADVLRDGPSRRRQTTAAPQGERKNCFYPNGNTVRAEEAALLSGRLEASSARSSAGSAGEEGSEPHSWQPLRGVRVLDFTWVVAGPLATRVLADHGAEVIKVERPDAKSLDRRREALHASLNRGKRSIILDMETPRGVQIARDLVRHCDVVIDNFSSRVMQNWGLSYTELRAIKPEIVTLGMSGFGRDGPFRDYVSYGPTLQAMAGFTWHMRRPGGEPTGWGFSYSDMVSGYSAAFAVLAALRHRSRTGQGQSIDLAQYEALLSFIGPELVAAAAGCSLAVPSTPEGAPEGIYRCKDRVRNGKSRDRWCAVAVSTDDEWQRFVRVIGEPEWALEPRFASGGGRIAHREDLDALVEAWTSRQSAERLMTRLQAAGIAAGIVADAEDLCVHDLHLDERRYWQSMRTAEGSSSLLDAVTPRLSHTPGAVSSLARQPGDDTDRVLREILHMEQTRIDALRHERIIA